MKYVIFIFLVFSSFFANAQVGLSVESHIDKNELPSIFSLSNLPLVSSINPASSSLIEENTTYQPPENLKGLYNCDELAFFCKVELNLEKKIKLPVKFRLGSVDYVNRLEGKGFDSWW